MKSNYALSVKGKLLGIINEMSANKQEYVVNPEKDFTRDRKLPFATMLQTIFSMGGQSIRKELLTRLGFSTETPTASAFVQQREKILPAAFEHAFQAFTGTLPTYKRYKGYRLLAVDSSDVPITYDPYDDETYLRRNAGYRGCSQYHLIAMYDLCNKIYTDALVHTVRNRNEFGGMVDLVRRCGDFEKIILADRGFASFNVFANLHEHGCKYVVRVHEAFKRTIFSKWPLPKEEDEFDVQITRQLTYRQTKLELSQPDVFYPIGSPRFDFLDEERVYYPFSVRIVRFRLPSGDLQAVATNLPANKFPSEALKEIYHMRWGIETSFRLLKHNLGLPYFHAKKRPSILQEIFSKLTMFNFCSSIIENTAKAKDGKKHPHIPNFAVASYLCMAFLRGMLADEAILDSLLNMHSIPVRKNRRCRRPKSNPRHPISFDYRFA